MATYKNYCLFTLLLFLNPGCIAVDGNNYHALVSQHKISSSAPVYNTIQAAINAAPQNTKTPFRIFISAGNYYEKIVITKNNIQLMGAGENKTRISYADYAGKLDLSGKVLTTFGTASLRIKASDIRIENLTIENTFDFLTNDALAPDRKIIGSQAVALFIDVPSDRIILRNISLLGYQDTLFVNSGRSWFDQVFIAGNVDYIFGGGTALFTDSEIKTRARVTATNPYGFITAPSTHIDNNYGLIFLKCRLTRDRLVPDNSVALGRPWHPTTTFADGRYADPDAIGKSIFINGWMDAHIISDGWYSMSGIARDGGKKSFLPEDSRFFEYQSTGPGAFINSKRRQLKDEEAISYTKEKILGDWQPQ
ncbi:MAG: pectinesterase family protein [Pseudomonadota bacterium]